MPSTHWRFSVVTGAVLLSAVWLGGTIAQKSAVRPFIVAVGQSITSPKGTGLLPIARFTGQSWVNSWPEPDDVDRPVPELSQVPTAWLGAAVPRTWTFWWSGTMKSTVRVTRTLRDPDGCSTPVVLMLDGVPAPPAGLRGDHPIGIAVDTDQPVEFFVDLRAEDSERADMVATIESMFRANQERLLAAPGLIPSSAPASVRRETDLSTRPITIKRFSRPVGAKSKSLYYFEATKQTPRTNGRLVGVRVAAWIQMGTAGQWLVLDEKTGWFTEESLATSKPIALLRVLDRTFLVIHNEYYESDDFTVEELLPGGVHRILRAGAGGC